MKLFAGAAEPHHGTEVSSAKRRNPTNAIMRVHHDSVVDEQHSQDWRGGDIQILVQSSTL